MAGILHVTFLACLRASGRNVRVQVAAVERSALHRHVRRIQDRTQSVALPAHQ